MKLTALLLGCVFALAAGGCNPRDAGNLTEDTKNLVKHTGEAVGSVGLAGKVNTVLSLRKGVDMSGLHIEADNGVVKVGGHVRNAEEKRRVLDTVDGIRGVDKVVDDLRIEEKK
jgi:osmotically-inducible protein OsmY